MANESRGYRALLLDDDPYALDLLRAMLAARFPGLDITTRTKPDPSGEFDFYFLDDDFEGVRLARKLARRIREERPEAVILAFSASLDERTLRDLLEAGCAGVCDKQVPGDMPEMMGALERGMRDLEEKRKNLVGPDGRPRLLRTFRALFREWNRRLDSQDSSAA